VAARDSIFDEFTIELDPVSLRYFPRGMGQPMNEIAVHGQDQ
jgi:hypothetical protein